MHPYAIDTPKRDQVTVTLMFLSIAIGLGLHLWIQEQQWDIPWWIDVPSVFAVFGLLVYMFDQVVWRVLPGWVKRYLGIPDLNGTWRGVLKTTYDEFKHEHQVEVEIEQTWRRISIRLKANHSSSRSLTATITTNQSKCSTLSYEYWNEPRPDALKTMEMHRGTAIFELASPDKMEGHYYTGRGREKRGMIALKKKLF